MFSLEYDLKTFFSCPLVSDLFNWIKLHTSLLIQYFSQLTRLNFEETRL